MSNQDLNDDIENPTRQYKIGDSIIYIYLLKKRACYIKIYSEVTEKEYLFKSDYQWAEIKTNLKFINQVEYTILSHAIMFMFIYSSSFYNTVFFDASSVMIDKEGIAFLGEPGVGKTTHSKLWLEQIKESSLLCDGQTAIRILDDDITISRTPWSIRNTQYEDNSLTLDTIFILEQAEMNVITKASNFTSFCKLLSICSMIQEEKESFNCIVRTIVHIAESIPIYILKNKHGSEAVNLAYSTYFKTVV